MIISSLRARCYCMWHSARVKRSFKHPHKHASEVHLFDRRLPPYEPSRVVVSQRNSYPNWGHGKCILNECHDSHTQNEVMWWDAVRTRFIMLSLCMYNAHRMLELSGSIGGWCYNPSINFGWPKLLQSRIALRFNWCKKGRKVWSWESGSNIDLPRKKKKFEAIWSSLNV